MRRLATLQEGWPWRLLAAVQPNGQAVDQLVLQDFLNEDGCCLDEWFSEPLRRACPTLETLRAPHICAMLRALLQHCVTTNMQLENRLAQIKSSCPRSKGGFPNIENLAYTSSLSQLFHDHLERGGFRIPQQGLALSWSLGLMLVQGGLRDIEHRHM